MSKLHLFLLQALAVLAHPRISLWLVSISDEGSLPEIALSDASKLASTYLILFYSSVHVLYTKITVCLIIIMRFVIWILDFGCLPINLYTYGS